MKLTVTQRIGGGYAVVLALAFGILLTGLVAITRINAGLLDVTDRAAPMLSQGGQLQTALLRAHAAVNRHLQQSQLTELAAIEAEFSQQRQATEQSLQALLQLSDGKTELTTALTDLSTRLTPIFETSNAIFAAHRSELEFAASVGKKSPPVRRHGG